MRWRRQYLTLLLCVALVGVARLARGQDGTADYIYQVLFDTDNNPATGCTVSVDDTTVGSTTFDGVERLVRVTVARIGATGTVSGITVHHCVSGTTFGPPQPVSPGGWPVGNGGGRSVIEGFVPGGALADGGQARVAFTASRATPGSDVLLSTSGEPGGAPILFLLPFQAPAPLLSTAGLALSVLLLGGVTWWSLRRRLGSHQALLLALALTAAMAATALALTIVMDGEIDDWGTLSAVAMDPTHDSTNNDPAEDLVAGFLTAEETTVYFRMDVVNIADLCAGVMCAAKDQCHAVGTCDLYTGMCSDPAKEDGTACDFDSNGCTQDDSCQSGVCTAGTTVVCNTPADAQCQSATGTCNSTGNNAHTCSYTNVSDGTGCNLDSDGCTQDDSCQSGACTAGATVVCNTPADAQCQSATGTCNSTGNDTHTCTYTNVADDTACDDGSVCTLTDTCQSGTCTGSGMLACTATNPCERAFCDPTINDCTTVQKADGATCDAGTDAAVTQICTSGACGACTTSAASPRFVDNGDGTVTDRSTCLVWEKKDQAGGLHDWSHGYGWAGNCFGENKIVSGMVVPISCSQRTGTCCQTDADCGIHPPCQIVDSQMTGLSVFGWLAQLNAGAGFAAHHDWRLPKSAGQLPTLPSGDPAELESILTGCAGGPPCVNAAFNTGCVAGCNATGASPCSCTQGSNSTLGYYWSASERDTWSAFIVPFQTSVGATFPLNKVNHWYVRAVRGGPQPPP
jgi:hypothetical protein